MEVGAEVEVGAPKVLRHLQEDPLIKRQEVVVAAVAVAAAGGQKLGRRPPNRSWQRGPVEVEEEVEEALLLLWC